MSNVQMIFEEIEPVVATLNMQERLELIQKIAAFEYPLEPQSVNGRQSDAAERRQQLFKEQNAWFAKSIADRRQYAGRYVALQAGEVVDHDTDPKVLYQRIRHRFRHAPVPILHAELTDIPEFTIHSPRLMK